MVGSQLIHSIMQSTFMVRLQYVYSMFMYTYGRVVVSFEYILIYLYCIYGTFVARL